jgi:hypothetical protein|tara:strand:- start:962 stop:1117 length:156 start_codon:yes stop_codon:yes gene_type:complete
MPKVGKKHFAYNSAGTQAAKRESARTGQPLVHKKKAGLADAMRGASYGKTS